MYVCLFVSFFLSLCFCLPVRLTFNAYIFVESAARPVLEQKKRDLQTAARGGGDVDGKKRRETEYGG